MSLQTIIDQAQSINFSRRKIAGHTLSRSGQIRISSIASSVPWVMNVAMHPALKYSTHRYVVEDLDALDRVQIQTINIGSTNPGLSYITQYQGDFNSRQLQDITISSANVLTLTLDVSNVSGERSDDIVFRKGDFIQPDAGYKYPYTVTQDVVRGAGSTLDVQINRPFISQTGYTPTNKGIVVGTDVTWNMVLSSKPTWKLIPHDRIEFTSEFEFTEVIEV